MAPELDAHLAETEGQDGDPECGQNNGKGSFYEEAPA